MPCEAVKGNPNKAQPTGTGWYIKVTEFSADDDTEGSAWKPTTLEAPVVEAVVVEGVVEAAAAEAAVAEAAVAEAAVTEAAVAEAAVAEAAAVGLEFIASLATAVLTTAAGDWLGSGASRLSAGLVAVGSTSCGLAEHPADSGAALGKPVPDVGIGAAAGNVGGGGGITSSGIA